MRRVILKIDADKNMLRQVQRKATECGQKDYARWQNFRQTRRNEAPAEAHRKRLFLDVCFILSLVQAKRRHIQSLKHYAR